MTDEQAGDGNKVEAGPGPDLALRAASTAKADAYLEEQTRLARLQSQNLIEQNAFELSHLRWRRFNDQMKGALQIMVVALGAADRRRHRRRDVEREPGRRPRGRRLLGAARLRRRRASPATWSPTT